MKKRRMPEIGDKISIKIIKRRERTGLFSGTYNVIVTDKSSWQDCFFGQVVGSSRDILFHKNEIVV